MIRLEILTFNRTPPAQPKLVDFDEFGGTVGRSPDCSLTLTDETRGVSRIHAKVGYREGKYLITDEGTNPLKVNGVPLGKGNSTAIHDGDRIVIGPYELAVRAGQSQIPQPAAPLAAEFGDAPGSSAASPAPTASPKASSADSANPFGDLLGTSDKPAPDANPFGSATPSSASEGGGILDGLGMDSDRRAFPEEDPLAPPHEPIGALPDDFDPMAPPPAASDQQLPPAGADLPDDAFSEFGNSPKAPGEGSLDAMFGLSSESTADPMANSPLGKAPPSHDGGTDSGLTQWIGGIKGPDSQSTADSAPEISSAFQPPNAVAPKPNAAARPQLPDFSDLDPAGNEPLKPAQSGVEPAAELSPASPKSEPSIDDLLGSSPPSSAASNLLGDFDAAVQPPPAPPPAAAQTHPAAATAEPVEISPELLQALLQGLNSSELKIDQLTPELMFKIGTLLHEATSGTVALLAARGSVKREMRADVTMIASGRNNPLKFSPDAGMAIRYMLGQPMPGFMDADEAMRDAYGDLRAHEFGFMAGLRAALSDVLKRFEPARLEARLPEKSGVGSLLSSSRKARLWEMFGQLYQDLTVEAEEDFHAIFGREFLRAYEQHIKALEQARRNKP